MGKAVIAIHGGAGAISRAQMTPEREREYVAALSTIVESGQKMLAAGASALDAVTEAVRLLEECPLFNAGMGAVFTRDQTHELDACVMDGYSLQAGAVAGVKHLRNPVLAARLVLEKSPHVLLIGEGAENFAISHGMARVDNDLFSTPERLLQLQEAKAGGEDYPRPPRRSPRRTPENGHRRRGGARSGRQSGGGDLHRRHDQQTARTRRRQPAAGRGVLCQ